MSGIRAFFHSSFARACEEGIDQTFAIWASDSAAHFGVAVFLSALVVFRGWSVRWLWAGVATILAKEVFFDLPHSGWATLVIIDSIWDLVCWFVGFFSIWIMFVDWKEGRGDAA